MSINGIGKEFRIRVAGSNDVTVGNMADEVRKFLGKIELPKISKSNKTELRILGKDSWYSSEIQTKLAPEQKKNLRDLLLSVQKGDSIISFTPISPSKKNSMSYINGLKKLFSMFKK